jgi:hypothetical protein
MRCQILDETGIAVREFGGFLCERDAGRIHDRQIVSKHFEDFDPADSICGFPSHCLAVLLSCCLL